MNQTKKTLGGILFFSILFLAGCSDSVQDNAQNIDQVKIEAEQQIDATQKISQPKYGVSKTIPNFFAVSPKLFQELYDMKKFIVIDVRSPAEIAEGKIFSEALEINFYNNNFKQKIAQLDKTKKYLIYCRSGGRSGKALRLMKNLGFSEAYDLAGGTNAWNAWSQKKLLDAKKNIPATGKERVITITAKQFEFGTTEIRVKQNEKVKIVVDNLDGMHGINIPALGQKNDKELILDTSKKGVFAFGCNNLCGVGHSSMRGQIIVE